MAIGRPVVSYGRDGNTFSVGIVCRHCTSCLLCNCSLSPCRIIIVNKKTSLVINNPKPFRKLHCRYNLRRDYLNYLLPYTLCFFITSKANALCIHGPNKDSNRFYERLMAQLATFENENWTIVEY